MLRRYQIKILIADPRNKQKSREFRVREHERIRMGRNPAQNQVVLKDSTVSRSHLVMGCLGGKLFVRDLKSVHGTLLNGNKIRKATRVRVGDKLFVGETVLLVQEFKTVSLLKPLFRKRSSKPKKKLTRSTPKFRTALGLVTALVLLVIGLVELNKEYRRFEFVSTRSPSAVLGAFVVSKKPVPSGCHGLRKVRRSRCRSL